MVNNGGYSGKRRKAKAFSSKTQGSRHIRRIDTATMTGGQRGDVQRGSRGEFGGRMGESTES